MGPRAASLALSLFLLIPTVADATTYLVTPDGTGDFPTIQAAIDAASPGDVIELADGTFTGDGNRNIDVLGKGITIRSQSDDAASCIVDCELEARGFFFTSGESRDALLQAVTVTNAGGPGNSIGALYVNNFSAPTIDRCVFANNSAYWAAGMQVDNQSAPLLTYCSFIACGERTIMIEGESQPIFRYCEFIDCIGPAMDTRDDYFSEVDHCLFMNNSRAVNCGFACTTIFRDCLFVGNHSETTGGAIWSFAGGYYGGPELDRCTFIGNWAEEGGAVSGGILTIRNCTFVLNDAQAGSAIRRYYEDDIVIENCILAFNLGGIPIQTSDPFGFDIRCLDIYGNEGGDWVGPLEDLLGINGNISVDPHFCDFDAHDLTLRSDSPCAAGNNPECGLIGAWDVGCDEPTPIEMINWGRIKAAYR